MVVIFLAIISLLALASGLELPPLINRETKSDLSDFDTRSFTPSSSGSDLQWHQQRGKYTSTGRLYSAFISTFSPSYFSFYPPATSGCTALVKPSISSSTSYNCEYATNGGFFTWNYSLPSLCIGNLISDGYVWQLPTDGSGTERVNFGISSNHSYMIGFLDSTTIELTSFRTLLTGCGWLVRDGKSYVSSSRDLDPSGTFTTEKAPRTSVGFFANGTMALVQVDGCEQLEAGPDLYELAELLVSLGLQAAVNLDGGGSSVSVYKGTVVDRPTCNDTPEECEREDASIACVKLTLTESF